MRDFFHSGKRKFGLVTLALTGLFASAWIRSLSNSDRMALTYGNIPYFVISHDGSLGLQARILKIHEPESPSASFTLQNAILPQFSSQVLQLDERGLVGIIPSKRRWEWCGFGYGVADSNPPVMKNQVYTAQVKGWAVPYGSIVIPFTLLSVYLLFSKPRQAIKNATTPPSSAGV